MNEEEPSQIVEAVLVEMKHRGFRVLHLHNLAPFPFIEVRWEQKIPREAIERAGIKCGGTDSEVLYAAASIKTFVNIETMGRTQAERVDRWTWEVCESWPSGIAAWGPART